MLLSGGVILDSNYFKGTINSIDARWGADSWLVDLDRGYFYYFRSQNTRTNFSIAQFDLDGNKLETWDGDIQGYVEGVSNRGYFCFNEDKSQIVVNLQLPADISGNSIRFATIDINFNDFENSPVTYSDLFDITTINNPLETIGKLPNGDVIYISMNIANASNARIGIYNYNSNTDVSSELIGINYYFVPSAFKFDYKTNKAHIILADTISVSSGSSKLIKYLIYDYNTQSIEYISDSFNTQTYLNLNISGLYLLDVSSDSIEIGYYDLLDGFRIAIFTKNLSLITFKKINFTLSNRNFFVLKKVSKSDYYIWLLKDFYRARFVQSTKTIPLLSGNVVSGEQSNKSVILQNDL